MRYFFNIALTNVSRCRLHNIYANGIMNGCKTSEESLSNLFYNILKMIELHYFKRNYIIKIGKYYSFEFSEKRNFLRIKAAQIKYK